MTPLLPGPLPVGTASERVARDYSDIDAARLLHEQGGKTAVEVEARLLARQSTQGIARILALPPSLITIRIALLRGHEPARRKGLGSRVGRSAGGTSTPEEGGASTPCCGPMPTTAAPSFWRPSCRTSCTTASARNRRTSRRHPEGRLDLSIRLAIEVDLLPQGEKIDQKLLRVHAQLLADAQKAAAGRRNDGAAALNIAETLAKLTASGVEDEVEQRPKHPPQGESLTAGKLGKPESANTRRGTR